jgi:hypothetical protein
MSVNHGFLPLYIAVSLHLEAPNKRGTHVGEALDIGVDVAVSDMVPHNYAVFTVVPAPATAWLLGPALVAPGGRRRKRTARAVSLQGAVRISVLNADRFQGLKRRQ